jgi:hypothetical protein
MELSNKRISVDFLDILLFYFDNSLYFSNSFVK